MGGRQVWGRFGSSCSRKNQRKGESGKPGRLGSLRGRGEVAVLELTAHSLPIFHSVHTQRCVSRIPYPRLFFAARSMKKSKWSYRGRGTITVEMESWGRSCDVSENWTGSC